MTTTTKAVQHTPGAVKAAKLMAISPKVRQLALGLILREEFAKELAEIIDRETGAPEMLEALEELYETSGEAHIQLTNSHAVRKLGNFIAARDKAKAVIRKALGEQTLTERIRSIQSPAPTLESAAEALKNGSAVVVGHAEKGKKGICDNHHWRSFPHKQTDTCVNWRAEAAIQKARGAQ